MKEIPIADIASTMAELLRSRLNDIGAEAIVVSRDEAALLLGLAEGVAEILASELPRSET